MDRRVFLLATLALGGCGVAGARPTSVLCDPDLVRPLERALKTRGARAYRLEGLSPKGLQVGAEATEGAILVTREPKLADRLQRLGLARLQNRWKTSIGGGPVILVVTRGAGEGAAVHLAKWLASDAAAGALSAP